jgi:hypothetical protein
MKRPQISLLVPFRASAKHPHRARIWEWLKRYWSHELPDAEIVVGHSTSEAFCKTEAVNDAAARARGRIFVILDSDAYIRGSAILHCARAIEEAQRRGQKRWFIPYRRLYRLTEASAEMVLNSDPMWPYRFTSPPPDDAVESTVGSMHGHHFGAMIQIMPREAFEAVGCMDTRFKGWGGEDVAFMRAVDTLYAKHKTIAVDVLHLWHPNIGTSVLDRMWEGQDKPGQNSRLAKSYSRATGDRVAMRALVDAGCPKHHRCDCRFRPLCRFWRWLLRFLGY